MRPSTAARAAMLAVYARKPAARFDVPVSVYGTPGTETGGGDRLRMRPEPGSAARQAWCAQLDVATIGAVGIDGQSNKRMTAFGVRRAKAALSRVRKSRPATAPCRTILACWNVVMGGHSPEAFVNCYVYLCVRFPCERALLKHAARASPRAIIASASCSICDSIDLLSPDCMETKAPSKPSMPK